MHIEEVESIWSAIAEQDDWQPFEAKIAAVRRMGEAMARRRPALDRVTQHGERAAMAETLVSTEPATGAEFWSGEVGDAAAEVAAARAAWPAMGGPFARLPDRDAAPLRQCRTRAASEFRRADRARNRQALVGSEDRGRRGHRQGRDFGRRLSGADSAARLEAAMGNKVAVRHKPHGVLAVLGPVSTSRRICPTATSSPR